MKLGSKVIVAVASVMALFLLTLYALSSWVVLRGFSEIENRYASRNVTRVLSQIGDMQRSLGKTVGDWAYWDDTYEFVNNLNKNYEEQNLSSDSFKVIGVHVVLFVDPAGRVVIGKTFDPGSFEERPLDAAEEAMGARLARTAAGRESVEGLVVLDGRPMLVAARQILTSKREGPARGLLIMGLCLDDEKVRQIAQVLESQVSILRTDMLTDGSPERAIAGALEDAGGVEIRRSSSDLVSGFGLVRSLVGKPDVLIRVDMPRDIHRKGLATVSAFTALLSGWSVIIALGLIVLLRRQVVTRLEGISRQVSAISTAADVSLRVSTSGSDELSLLADKINHMLERMSEARRDADRSRRDYEFMFHNMMSGFAVHELVCDANGKPVDARYLSVNPAYERMTGLASGAVVGRTIREVLPRADLHWIEICGKVALTGEPASFDTYVADLDQYFEFSVFRPAPRQFAYILTDITESTKELSQDRERLEDSNSARLALLGILEDQTRTQDALRESQEMLRTVVDGSSDPIYLKDQEGCYLLFNAAAAKVVGRTAEEVIGHDDRLIFPPDEARVVMEGDRKVMDTGAVITYEEHVTGAGGVDKHFLSTKGPRWDTRGQVIGLWGIAHDITERVKAEKAIREQSEFLQRMIDSMPYPVFYKDNACRYLGCNRAFEQFFGVTRDKITGKTPFDIAPKDLADAYFRTDQELFAHPGTQTYEGAIQSADGVRHDVIFHKATFEGPDGKLAGLIGAVVDITDRKAAEAAVQKQLDELRRWHKAMLGRESRVIELKREVNELLRKAGQDEKYGAVADGNGGFHGAAGEKNE